MNPEAIEAVIAGIEDIITDQTGQQVFRSGFDGSFTRNATAVAGMLEDLIREARAAELEAAAEAWEALVRNEKPPIRGYMFLRDRAAAIRAGEA